MQDTTTQLVEMVEELVAELRHADTLITHQEEHIRSLEAEIAVVRNVLGPAAA